MVPVRFPLENVQLGDEKVATAVDGNWPDALTDPCETVRVMVPLPTPVTGPDHTPLKVGMKVAVNPVEASVQVEPVICAVPAAVLAPFAFDSRGS